MKTILCYGDSNTWGSVPGENRRYDLHERWPGVLRDTLGPDYWIVEEGLPGRTTVHDDPVEGDHKNGLTYLYPCLESHTPLDGLVLMLGTNDLKQRFSVSAYDIAQSAGLLLHTIKQGIYGVVPQVLLICPPPTAKLTNYAEMFAGATEKSRDMAPHYRRIARELGVEFLDAGKVILSSDIDGIHLEASEHQKLGLAVAERLKAMLA